MSLSYRELQGIALSSINQVLVDISPTNTKALLADASEAVRSRRVEAEAILSRLRTLNPIVGSQFELKEDVIGSLQLRMICSDPAPSEISSFAVVSYCWHSAEWATSPAADPIARGWEVSRPMVDTIMSLRKSPEEGVWLDKVCIDQTDPRDKTVHIGGMDLIYRSARRVIILLEDVQLDYDDEAAGITYARMYQDMSDAVMEQKLEGQEKSDFVDRYFPEREAKLESEGFPINAAAAKRFVIRILTARWFSRAWCAHESRVTIHRRVDNPLFLCYGHDGRVLQFEFRAIHYIAMRLSDTEPVPSLMGKDLTTAMNDPNPTALRQLWWRMSKLHGGPEPNSSSMQHVVSLLTFGCLKKGDLMSIALNTSGLPLYFKGDASTLEEVIWIFSLLVLATGDALPLLMDGEKLMITDDAQKEMVSWAVEPHQGLQGNSTPIMAPSSITAATKGYIELDLFVFDSLPMPPSPKSFETAEILIEEHDLQTLAQTMVQESDEEVQRTYQLIKAALNRARGHDGPLRIFVQSWIAYGLDTGLAWAMRLPDVMRKDTSGSWMKGSMGEYGDPRLTAAATSLLQHFPEGQVADAEQRHAYIANLVKFLTCVLEPRLSFFTVNPRRLPCGDADHAITQSQSNRSWIAVPVAIAHLPSWQKRAWVVEPFDPMARPERVEDFLPDIDRQPGDDEKTADLFPLLTSDSPDRRTRPNKEGNWRLRHRQEIFGCGSLMEAATSDNGHLMLLKKQRVYGSLDYDWGAITKAISEFEERYGKRDPSL
jgi:hypothetical protein